MNLPTYKFHEPGQENEEDQRPLARYLRHLKRTNPALEMQLMQQMHQGQGRHLPMLDAYLRPFFWMCHLETDDKTFGNHIVADQDIKANSIIGMEHPIVFVTAEQDRCAECDRQLTTIVKCNHHDHAAESCPLMFCSQKCRDFAWETYHKVQDHQDLGDLYANCLGQQHFLDMIFSLKIISMMQLPESNEHALSYIAAFLENPHLIEKAPLYKMRGTEELLKIVKMSDSGAMHKYELMPALFALRSLYAFGNTERTLLYGPSCFVNHSCEPNVTVGALMGHDEESWGKVKPFGQIESLRPIKKGEQLCFDYRSESMTPRSMRKANLKIQYGFDCHCRLCNDGISRCDHAGCGAVNASLKRCTKCKSAAYCNRTCQGKDWAHHKKYCGLKANDKCF